MKVAFFDRDGTIIEDYPDHEWTEIRSPVFIKGSIHTLKKVLENDYKIIIITNQYIIGESYITDEQYHDITNQMLNVLKLHEVDIYESYYCPHAKMENCPCSKPRTGLIEQALKDHPEINLSESFMIGDSIVDIDLAINMKIKGFGIRVGSDYTNTNVVEIETIEDLISYL